MLIDILVLERPLQRRSRSVALAVESDALYSGYEVVARCF